jgi:hypothetical protein
MENKQAVISSIAKVSGMLAQDGISKGRKNQQQGYAFRGIDDVLNALAPMLSAEGLVVIPTVTSRECVERATKSGGSLFYVAVSVQFRIISTADGSEVTATVYGEAMDSADKATNKAMSAAYKYWAILTFCIPTEGDNDADAHTHQPAPAIPMSKSVGTPSERAKAMPTPAKPDGAIPPQVLKVLDAITDMPGITAKCSEYKPMAQKEGWERELFRYWQKRDDGFKALQKEVFGDE